MWQVKKIDPKTKREKVVKKGLDTKQLAEKYISENMEDIPDVWVEEKMDKKNSTIDISDKKGLWIWIYSTKKNEFFPYGIVVDFTNQFAKIQTKEEVTDYFNLADMRIERIKNMFEAKTLRFEIEGYFVTIKDYL